MYLIWVVIVIVSVLLLYSDRMRISRRNDWNLNENGFIIIKNTLNDDEIGNLKLLCLANDYINVKDHLHKHERLQKLIRKYTSELYQFQDYIWIIKKSSVHTCHRDNNGDFFNKGQKYPSYTMLIYLEDMDNSLDVIDKSHKVENKNNFDFNISDPLTKLGCKSGDIILFNANLIHVGTINDIDDNLRIQMKVTHRDDRDILNYYEDYNKILNKDNKIPKWIRKIQKHVSCMVPGLSDKVQNVNIKSARGSDNGASIGLGQKVFSSLYYGDSSFYDLPNAF
jgi:hypothetical protein